MWNARTVSIVAAALVATAVPGATADAADGAHDFDFVVGEWRVHHRRLKPGTREWIEFEGTCSTRKAMAGSANVEEHALDSPTGAYQAAGLRAFDAKTGQWAIWWLDGRYPSRPLDPPAKGRFEDGVGRFYADYTQDGKPMRGRLQWSEITATSARFEQSSSADGGKTWSPNWIMKFERATGAARPGATEPSDFDFLHGEGRVRHRYLRVGPGGREWVDASGTASQRPLMGGRANLEEHTIDAPSGSYRALALRSFDAKTSEWSIWWLDGRSPHEPLDPPVRGRFERGIGTFHGDTTIGGKPTRVRFIWSEITPASARWEQAYAPEEGGAWESNWVMEFSRDRSFLGRFRPASGQAASVPGP
jgi:hypothetical protein